VEAKEIVGRLVSTERQAVASGKILAMPSKGGRSMSANWWYRTPLGPAGRFRLTGLPPGNYELRCLEGELDTTSAATSVQGEHRRIHGAWTSIEDARSIAAGANDIELRTTDTIHLSGRVLGAAAEPVSDAEVLLQIDGMTDQIGVRTTSDGTFDVGGLDVEDSCSIEVRSPGFRMARVSGVRPNGEFVAVRMQRGEVVSGRIVVGSDVPMSGAVVRLTPLEQNDPFRLDPATEFEVVADDDGRFECREADGVTFRVVATLFTAGKERRAVSRHAGTIRAGEPAATLRISGR
jgi:hypothetical protein